MRVSPELMRRRGCYEKQKILALTLCFTLIFGLHHLGNNNINQVNAEECSTQDRLEVEDTIKSYFSAYEKCYDSNDYHFMDLKEYFNEDSLKENYTLHLLNLYEKTEIQKQGGNTLKKMNKELSLHFNNYKMVRKDEIMVNVELKREWNYVQTPEMKSASVDNYSILMVNRNNQYKIKSITQENLEVSLKEKMYYYGIEDYSTSAIEDNKGKIKTKIANMMKQYETDNELYEYEDQLNPEYNSRASGYNRSAAAAYATQWALGRNPQYANFENLGGDCTNFISQCLYAGGIPMHTGSPLLNSNWFYITSSNRSSTWTGANNFRQYLLSSSSKISYYNGFYSNVQAGDIVQLLNSSGNAYHSLIVSYVVFNDEAHGRSDVRICCHTSDRLNVSIKEFTAEKAYYRITGGK